MTGLVLLVGVLWVFGGLQSGVLAQDGGKFSYPRALERLESLVATLNESLQEELQEVRLGLNLTKKILGEVQGEKQSLEAALVETRRELAATKSLHQQAIDELRAAQDSSRMEALERQGSKLEKGLKQVRRNVSGLEDAQLNERLTAIENEQLPRRLNQLTRDLRRLEDENLPRRVSQLAIDYNKIATKVVITEFRHNGSTSKLKEELHRVNMAMKANLGVLEDDVERVERQLCEKLENVTAIVEDTMESSKQSTADIEQEIARSSRLAAKQQESIYRLTTEVTQQGQSVNQLNDSVADQGRRLDNLTSTVEEQGSCIASLKEDVEWIKINGGTTPTTTVTSPQPTSVLQLSSAMSPTAGEARSTTTQARNLFTSTPLPTPNPGAQGGITDCYDAMMKGARESGVYIIQPKNTNNSFGVYCDMETDGGGWTVLLKRQDGSVDFYRNWTDYKSGFGNLEGEHWLGLDNMYLLTNLSGDPPQLRVDLADWEGNTAFAKYDQFSVGAEDSEFTLSASGYQNASTAGDSLTADNGYHNGQRFSTPDRDNDISSYLHCAVFLHGPWWHRSCNWSLLTGKYYTSGEPSSSTPNGMNWGSWKGWYSLRVAEMKVRPGGV